MFNKFFISFLKDIKESSAELKDVVKSNYKVIDKLSTVHISEFWTTFSPLMSTIATKSTVELSEDEVLQSKIVVKQLDIKSVQSAFSSELSTFWNHVYILTIFANLYHENVTEQKEELDSDDDENDENDEDDNEPLSGEYDVLFDKVVDILGMLQKNEDISKDLEDVIDDDIKALLSKIKFTVKVDVNIEEKTNIEDIFGNLAKGSKIANLAKEISEDIDISNLKIEKPEDIMKMMDFSSGNNVMGDIIKKVGSKISSKIEKGELGQDELLSEAMSMMGMLGKSGGGGADALGGLGNLLNNPMISEIMKSMKKGKPLQTRGGDIASKASTKDRLKKKLEERKNITSDQ
jgi:hypothetical protein